MSQHIRNFIDAIADGDNIEARNEFDLAMSSKLTVNLNDKRQEVAQSFVNSNDIQEAKGYKPKKLKRKGKPVSDWQKDMEKKLAGSAASLAIYNADGSITLEVKPTGDVNAIQFVDSIVKSRIDGMTHNRKTYDKVKHSDGNGNTWEFNEVDFGQTKMYKIEIKPPKN